MLRRKLPLWRRKSDRRSGVNLKGFLRKLGRAYEQDAVVYKNYYRDAELHALNDLPDLGMANREKRSLGPDPTSSAIILH